MKSGIYQIVNKINQKKYIGSSKNIKRRLQEHKNNLIKNKHTNRHLQSAWNLYGENNFLFLIIEFVENEKLSIIEQDYINNFIPFNKKYIYNICETINAPPYLVGFHLTKETKEKISLSLKGKMTGENNPMYGRKLSDKNKKLLVEGTKNRKSWNKKEFKKVFKTEKDRIISETLRKNHSGSRTKLSYEKVEKIREIIKNGNYLSLADIGRQFSVDRSQISRIKNNITWREIDNV